MQAWSLGRPIWGFLGNQLLCFLQVSNIQTAYLVLFSVVCGDRESFIIILGFLVNLNHFIIIWNIRKNVTRLKVGVKNITRNIPSLSLFGLVSLYCTQGANYHSKYPDFLIIFQISYFLKKNHMTVIYNHQSIHQIQKMFGNIHFHWVGRLWYCRAICHQCLNICWRMKQI